MNNLTINAQIGRKIGFLGILQFYAKGFTFKNEICLPVEKIDITAFKAEGFSYATCKPLKPPQDFPYMPTDPLLHDCFDIHSKKIVLLFTT